MWVITSKTPKIISDEMTTVSKFDYKYCLVASQIIVSKTDGRRFTERNTYKYNKKFWITNESRKTDGKPDGQKVKYTFKKRGYLVKRVSIQKPSRQSTSLSSPMTARVG